MRNSNKQRASNKRKTPQPVTLVDEFAGADAAYMDRCISGLQNSHSQTSLLCGDVYNVTLGTTTNNNSFTFANIVQGDDFTSMAAQFTTFRVRGIRFDVYDINPNSAATNYFCTFHLDGGSIPIAITDILDRPDCQVSQPGAPKISFTWRPKGTLENQFQATNSFVDFGGIGWYINTTASGTLQKYMVVIKSLVDFRGRK